MRPHHSLLLPLLLLLTSCGGGGGGSATPVPPAPPPVCAAPCAVTVNWVANREAGVNNVGGGYRLYYASTPNVALGLATLVTVPYDPLSGLTPTMAALQLTAGTWYVRVAAYSAINAGGSAPSAELAVAVP